MKYEIAGSHLTLVAKRSSESRDFQIERYEYQLPSGWSIKAMKLRFERWMAKLGCECQMSPRQLHTVSMQLAGLYREHVEQHAPYSTISSNSHENFY